MLKETSNTLNKNTYSENRNTSKDNMTCQDGFCSLPNQKNISKQDTNDINLFDPI